jgi:hypothetical protein
MIIREVQKPKQKLEWLPIFLLTAIAMILTVAGFLIGYYYHSGNHYNSIQYTQPTIEKTIVNNITTEHKTFVEPEYTQDCEVLEETSTGKIHFYCYR